MPSRRRRFARSIGIIVTFLLSIAAAAPASDWVEVRSPNFVVLSDAGPRAAQDVARELERIRALFGETMASLRPSPDPITVYAVKDRSTLERLAPEYGASAGEAPPGLFRPGFGRNDILLRTDAGGEHPFALLYHEYFHLLSRLNQPGLPLWLDEGLAEFWGHTVVRGERAEMGLPSEARLEPLRRRGLLPLAELLTASHDSPCYRNPEERVIFYAQSWALTHYLMLDEGGARRKELARYVDALHGGADPEGAAVAAFGDLEGLAARLRDYVGQRLHRRMVVPAPPSIDEDSLELRPLSEAEAAAVQADFLVWGPSYHRARALALQAIALAPELALPKEVLGALELREQARPQAFKWFAEAARSPGASHLAHFYAASLAPPEAGLDFEQTLLEALSSRPSFAPAYVELAYHYAGLGATDEAIAMVERASEISPRSSWYRSLLARVLWRAGRRPEARRAMRSAVELALAAGQAEEAHDLCRYGSLAGMAEAVLPACDRAVALRPGFGPFRDSRAVAREMLGDHEGAVADFRAYLADERPGRPAADEEARRQWIRKIEHGEAIFGEATRRELLGRPF